MSSIIPELCADLRRSAPGTPLYDFLRSELFLARLGEECPKHLDASGALRNLTDGDVAEILGAVRADVVAWTSEGQR